MMLQEQEISNFKPNCGRISVGYFFKEIGNVNHSREKMAEGRSDSKKLHQKSLARVQQLINTRIGLIIK